jgi:diacylglycerol kinase (ATP)
MRVENDVLREEAPMNKPRARGLARLVNATRWSLAGFRSALRHEEAFRQELALFVLLTPVGLWLGDTGVERALLVGSLLVVLITELLNTAVESVVDRISPEAHALSKRAKDVGSAAVFLSLVCVAVTWGLILLG